MTDLQKRLEAICRLNGYEFAGEHRHCLELGAKVALEIDRSAPGAVDDSAPHVILAPHNCRICDSEPDVRPFGNDVVFSCENAECFMSDHDFTFSDWQTLMAAPGGETVLLNEIEALRQDLDGLRAFVAAVAKQKPQKPDYWSACSQCESNISDAEDLIEAMAKEQGDE